MTAEKIADRLAALEAKAPEVEAVRIPQSPEEFDAWIASIAQRGEKAKKANGEDEDYLDEWYKKQRRIENGHNSHC